MRRIKINLHTTRIEMNCHHTGYDYEYVHDYTLRNEQEQDEARK